MKKILSLVMIFVIVFSMLTVHFMGSAKAASYPDLIVVEIDIIEGPSDDWFFSAHIKNQGPVSTEAWGSFDVSWWIDSDYMGEVDIDEIDAGETITRNTHWYDGPGWHTVKFHVDYFDFIPESNENNNDKSEDFYVEPVQQPDLIVEDISWTPSNPKVGDTISFTAAIRNQGPVGTEAWGSFDVSYWIDGNYLGELDIDKINAGQVISRSFSWYADSCGSHTVKFHVDYFDFIPESDENNNDKSEDFYVECLQVPVAVLSAFPTEVEVGETVTFDGSSSYDPDGGSIVSYWYDFDDGFDSGWTSQSTYPWDYTDEGDYYAKLKVEDDEGQISSWSSTVHIHVIPTSTQGALEHFDLDYHGTPPVSDGDDQGSITVNPSTTLTLFFYYGEGNAGNDYIVRIYPEWDKSNFIANSDNDESISEVGWEAGGQRWDKEAYTVPSTLGTYKIRVVYSASSTPPTWDSYDRLLAEGTIIVVNPTISLSSRTTDGLENIGTIIFKGVTEPDEVYNLPASVAKTPAWYLVWASLESSGYGDSYVFLQWETSGGIMVDSPNSPQTGIEITSAGELKAVWKLRVLQISKELPDGASYRKESATTLACKVTDDAGNPIADISVLAFVTPPGETMSQPVSLTDIGNGEYAGYWLIYDSAEAGTYDVSFQASTTRYTAYADDYFAVDVGTGHIASDVWFGNVSEGEWRYIEFFIPYQDTTMPYYIDVIIRSSDADQLVMNLVHVGENKRYFPSGTNPQRITLQNKWGNFRIEIYASNVHDDGVFYVGYMCEYGYNRIFEYSEVMKEASMFMGKTMAKAVLKKIAGWAATFALGGPYGTAVKIALDIISATYFIVDMMEYWEGRCLILTSATTDGKSNVGTMIVDYVEVYDMSTGLVSKTIHHIEEEFYRVHVQADDFEGYTFFQWEAVAGDPTIEFTYSSNTWITLSEAMGIVKAVYRPLGDKELKISAFSPVNILVTDSNGSRIGFDPETQSVVNEITNATYSGPGSEPQMVSIPNPLTGNYTVDAFGTGTGEYVITMQSMASNGSIIDSETWQGTAVPDEQYSETVRLESKGRLILPHDIEVTKLQTSKTVIGQGHCLNITVTIENQGEYTESFNATVYYNNTAFTLPGGKNYTTITLTSGDSTTITIPWNTTGTPKGNYTIKAKATPVLGEADLTDNTLTNGIVLVTIPGDVNGDGKVRIDDVLAIALAFGSNHGDPRYDPNLDINCDGQIRIDDVLTAALNFGKGPW